MKSDMRSALLTLVLAVGACGNPAPDEDAAPAEAPVSEARPDDSLAGDQEQAQLVAAAERIIAFLRGEAAFDPALFADTVTVFVAPEGGGAVRRFARQELRERVAWVVGTRVVTPFAGPAKLTTRFGQHFNCHEYPLASRYPDLARMPHVGTKLEPPAAASCLQAWNLTLVFAPETSPPVLTAAVYDRWEW